jgi:hypothetical protein
MQSQGTLSWPRVLLGSDHFISVQSFDQRGSDAVSFDFDNALMMFDVTKY